MGSQKVGHDCATWHICTCKVDLMGHFSWVWFFFLTFKNHFQKWCSPFGKLCQSFRTFNIDLWYDLAISFLGPYPREMRAYMDPETGMHTTKEACFITAKRWKQPKCHPTWMDEQDTVYPETRIIQPCKGMEHWHILQWGWTLKAWSKVREARHRRPRKYSPICMKRSESRKLQPQKANL